VYRQAWSGEEWLGKAVCGRQGAVSRGQIWQGAAGVVWTDASRNCGMWSGKVGRGGMRQARRDCAESVQARIGQARHGRCVVVRTGSDW